MQKKILLFLIIPTIVTLILAIFLETLDFYRRFPLYLSIFVLVGCFVATIANVYKYYRITETVSSKRKKSESQIENHKPFEPH